MNVSAHEKQSAASNSVVAALALTVIKLGVAGTSGSLGLLAEAAHSALDLVAALMTSLAVRLADKPADKEHPYGHGKIENVSALVETLLLLATCVWIAHEAWHRLTGGGPRVDASVSAFLVVIVSMIVDFSRARMLTATARKHKSIALEADALHFRSDILSSAVVLVGLVAVRLAGWRPSLAVLAGADAAAALVVAGVVGVTCFKMGTRAVAELMDTAPESISDEVKEIAEAVPQVQNCHAIRVRSVGAEVFIDAHVVLEGSLSLSEAHRIVDAVEDAVRHRIPKADITVHAEPPEAAGN
jgi:cation diffusion facilitator family transporter